MIIGQAVGLFVGLIVAASFAMITLTFLLWQEVWVILGFAVALTIILFILGTIIPRTGRMVNFFRASNNRRVLLVGALALMCSIQVGRHAWMNLSTGESLFISDLKDIQSAYNAQSAAKNGCTVPEYGEPRRPTDCDWLTPVVPKAVRLGDPAWWLKWATIFSLTFWIYGPIALRDDVSRAWGRLQQRLAERQQRLGEAAAAQVTNATQGGDGHAQPFRWGAAVGTMLLILEFLGDIFLHGNVARR